MRTTAYNGEAYVTFELFNGVCSEAVTLYLYYRVASVAEWRAINEDLSAWYAQTEDIDFSGVVFGQTDFASVARAISVADSHTSAQEFTGVYNGNGYALKNICDTSKTYQTNSSDVYALSLFAKIGKGGVVRGLVLSGVKMYSRNYTGLVACENYGVISDISITGCEVLNMYGAGAFVAAYNYGVIQYVLIANSAYRILPNSSNDGIVAYTNNGNIGRVACSGISFLSGLTQTPYAANGHVAVKSTGEIADVNGGNSIEYAGDIPLDGATAKFRADIWQNSSIQQNYMQGTQNYFNSLDGFIVRNAVWGYTGVQTHGGVIADNVAVNSDGQIVLIANGDKYEGPKKGINSSYYNTNGGKRTGGVIQSRNAYGPGRFEAVIKIPSFNGICSSMWLYNYIAPANYEIDIEVHGTAVNGGSLRNAGNLSSALCTSWLTETDNVSQYVPLGYPLNDGEFHIWRIDWHTGKNPRIDYYIDGRLLCTQTTHVPDNKMFLNIGCWFPNNWCGEPDFETDLMVVKSFAYTPFLDESAKSLNSEPKSGASGELFKCQTEIPKANLLANGNFEGGRQNFAWSAPAGAKIGDGITFTGALSQTVTMDCGGIEYALTLEGLGAASVAVEYSSIVNGVAVSGRNTFNYTGGQGRFTFTPPKNCTKFTLSITSQGEVTLYSANLNVA